MRLLLTRPAEDSAPLAALLEAKGIETLIEPLLRIDYLPGLPMELDGVQAVLATSANGVRALAARSDVRTVSVFAVGDATARAARELGFAAVDSAAGDVEALADLVRRRLDANKGPLLHVAGTALTGDLANRLAKMGFDYRREVLYRAVTSERLTDDTTRAIESGALNGVLLFSPRTATTFVRLVANRGLEGRCQRLLAFCLSQAVADRLAGLSWRAIIVAARPEQGAIVDAIVAQKR